MHQDHTASSPSAIMDSRSQRIAIRTCDRPGYLRRLLLSVSRRQSPHPVIVLVFDDTRDVTTASANQQTVDSARRRFRLDVRYLGRGWQQAYCAELMRCLRGAAAAIKWLLGERPKGVFTGGRLLNLIMLVLAGHRFTLFDDDYLLDRARHLGDADSRKLEWSRDPERQTLPHLSVRESRAAGQEWPHDPMDAHLDFLGRRLQDCLVPQAPGAMPLLDASEAGTPPDRLQLDQDSVILTTVNGQYGVPISPNCFYLFYQPSGESGPAWADPEKYRILRQGRAVWNVTFGPVIAGRTGSTPSGIDNRIIMPPTLPFCKGEDTLFCTLVKFLHPNAAHLYLPWALEHSRTANPWVRATFDRPQKIMLAKTIWKTAEDSADLASAMKTPEDRLEFLSQHYLDWAGRSTPLLREEIRGSFVRGVRWRIKVMSDCLAQVEDSRLQVHGDLRRALKQFKSDLEMKEGLPALEDNPGLKGEDRRIEWLAGVGRDFGLALSVWSRLWHVARDMQAIE